MVEKFSKDKTSRIRIELNLELKTNIVGDFNIYNFHEENFFKFRTDFKRKVDLKKLSRKQEIPAHDFQNST